MFISNSNRFLFAQNTSHFNAASGKKQLMSRANKAQKSTYTTVKFSLSIMYYSAKEVMN